MYVGKWVWLNLDFSAGHHTKPIQHTYFSNQSVYIFN